MIHPSTKWYWARADREYTLEQRFVGRPTIDAVVRAVATHCHVELRAIHTGYGGLARMMTAGLAVDVGLAALTHVASGVVASGVRPSVF